MNSTFQLIIISFIPESLSLLFVKSMFIILGDVFRNSEKDLMSISFAFINFYKLLLYNVLWLDESILFSYFTIWIESQIWIV